MTYTKAVKWAAEQVGYYGGAGGWIKLEGPVDPVYGVPKIVTICQGWKAFAEKVQRMRKYSERYREIDALARDAMNDS